MILAPNVEELQLIHRLNKELEEGSPACEHSQHATRHVAEQPAKYVVRVTYVCCGLPSITILLCESGWEMTKYLVLRCRNCGHWDVNWSRWWKIVEVL